MQVYYATCNLSYNIFTPQIKGIQRKDKPYIPLQRNISKCTPVYTEMYPGKVVALQKAKPFSSK